jgi:hypothetical protein
MANIITLHNVGGIAIQSGQDAQGNQFTQFFVDYLALQEDGECAQCAAAIDAGWVCVDGGEEYCFEHIRECDSPECPECEQFAEAEIRNEEES